MSKGNSPSFQVKDFYQKAKSSLKLNPAFGKMGFSRRLSLSESKRPSELVLVWGEDEVQVKETRPVAEKKNQVYRKLEKEPCCIILAKGVSLHPELEREIKKRGIPVFYSELSKKNCLDEMKQYFYMFYPQGKVIPGGLIKILSLGVLITGDSGIGKSESALELISRGYTFISDDVTLVSKSKDQKLIGSAPSMLLNFMEIRGLGIINIKEIFGGKSVSSQAEINLIIRLKRWAKGNEYDRLGLKSLEKFEIMGKKVPQIVIPVAPGRNIATLIEVACKIHSLREKGYVASQDIVDKLNRILSFHGQKGKLR
ncbi:HPr(Ser) kinase/phosphatase [bacterium]|nr:HPr(Ser) kinase/phosphatase [bacterium]